LEGRPLKGPTKASSTQLILGAVARIPSGRVATYGQVARLAGLPGAARQVGYAMARLGPDSGVPWQRVVRADGTIAPRSGPGTWEERRQARLLRDEGVEFDEGGRIDLTVYRWET
jgi:methylated-DNA-protein-cysteine methyltransferase-like protein